MDSQPAPVVPVKPRQSVLGRGIPPQSRRTRRTDLRRVVTATPASPRTTSTLDAPPVRLQASRMMVRTARQPSWIRTYRLSLVATDVVVVLAAVLLAQVVSLDSGYAGGVAADPSWSWLTPALVVVCWLGAMAIEGVWNGPVIGNGPGEFRRILWSSLLAFAVVGIYGYLTLSPAVRGYLLLSWPVGVIGLMLGHWWWRKWLTAGRRSGRHLRSMVVVGELAMVRQLCSTLQDRAEAGYRVVAACIGPDEAQRIAPDTVQGVPVAGGWGDIPSVLAETGAEVVAVAAGPQDVHDRVPDLAWSLEGSGVGLLVTPELTDVAGPRVHIRPISGLPLLRVSQPRFRGAKAAAKVSLDLLVAALSVVVLSPLLILAAVIVLVTDGGPILFHHRCVGRAGRIFRVWAFRCTPHKAKLLPAPVGDESTDSPRYDLQTTGIGRFLRRTGLDEAPRLFNVLALQMSLVGPMPRLVGNEPVARVPSVRPGITGRWVFEGAHEETEEDFARMDAQYVQNWSVLEDLSIMIRTLKLVVTGRIGDSRPTRS